MKIEEKDGKRWFNSHGRLAELQNGVLRRGCQSRVDGPERARHCRDFGGAADLLLRPARGAGLEAARLANDGIAQMVAKHPARLRGMAHLPMQDPDAAIAELERAVKEHEFKAVEVGTSIEGTPLADPRFSKVLKTIEQLGCFIFTHPYQCLAQGGMDDYYLANFVGFPLDTTMMVAHLMYSGALDELKDAARSCCLTAAATCRTRSGASSTAST